MLFSASFLWSICWIYLGIWFSGWSVCLGWLFCPGWCKIIWIGVVVSMVNRIIILTYVSVCKIIIVIIVRKVDHYSFLQWYAFLNRFPAFWTSQIKGSMMFWCFSLAHAQCWTLIFPEPLLKCFFMYFPNPFLVGNFVKLAWLYVTKYMRLGSHR